MFAFQVDKNTAKGRQVLGWRSGGGGAGRSANAGNLAKTVRDVLFAIDCDSANDRLLSVGQVNAYLDRLAAEQTTEKKGEVLRGLLKAGSSPRTAYYLVKIILRSLKAGISDAAVLEAWHPAAMGLWNTTSSMVRVCADLKDPRASGAGARVELGAPAQPFMARAQPSAGPLPAAAADAVQKLANEKALGPVSEAVPSEWPREVRDALEVLAAQPGSSPAAAVLALPPPSSLEASAAPPFYLEKKFDGFRIQLHVDGDGACVHGVCAEGHRGGTHSKIRTLPSPPPPLTMMSSLIFPHSPSQILDPLRHRPWRPVQVQPARPRRRRPDPGQSGRPGWRDLGLAPVPREGGALQPPPPGLGGGGRRQPGPGRHASHGVGRHRGAVGHDGRPGVDAARAGRPGPAVRAL